MSNSGLLSHSMSNSDAFLHWCLTDGFGHSVSNSDVF